MTVTGAVFLDRDGTVIEDSGFIKDPALVRLLPGAAEAIRRLNAARHRVVMVTNQSGLARGLIRQDQYDAVARRVANLLIEEGARLDETYFCPHYPPLTGPCECRKPGTLLYRTAADRFGLDLATSTWIGDRMSDIVPAGAFGGRGILVRTGEGHRTVDEASAAGFQICDDLAGAVGFLLG